MLLFIDGEARGTGFGGAWACFTRFDRARELDSHAHTIPPRITSAEIALFKKRSDIPCFYS